MPGLVHSRSKNGVASLAYSRSKNGVASLAYSRSKNGVASLAYSRSKNGVASLAYGIHVLAAYVEAKDVDGRDKPGHDNTLPSQPQLVTKRGAGAALTL